MTEDDFNPYASPHATQFGEWPVRSIPSLPIVATLITQGFLYRCVRLAGGVEAELIWNGRGPIETVRVNGVRVAAKSPVWYAPHFAFAVEASHSRHDIELDVRLHLLMPLAVKAFRIRVDGAVVYSEGFWRDHSGPS